MSAVSDSLNPWTSGARSSGSPRRSTRSSAPPRRGGELAHAWLITGPPGSGRSNLALRFAAALTAREPGDRERVFAQVRARTHPDVAVLTTQKVVIGIDLRDIATTAHYAPAEGRHRVIVIEDAD